MEFVGDDYVLLTTGDPPRVHAIYGTARLDPRSLARVPDIASGPSFTEEEKAVLDLAVLRPARVPESLSVEAIVVPQVSDAERSHLRRASGAVMFRALALSTVFQAPNDGGTAMSLIGDIVRSVPSYELQIGRDLSRAPELLREIISGSI
jgi:hypothetical protein